LLCGNVTLTAGNTYTGNTVVSNNGTLLLTGTATIDTTPTIELDGGTVDVTGRNDNMLTLASGQTLSGNGTIAGNLDNAGTLSPGTATTVGILGVTTNATLAGNTVVKLDAGTLTNDVLAVTGNLQLGGTLTIATNLSGALAAGQSFKLFNAATYAGAFSSVSPATPGPGLAWNTSTLAVNGTISIVSGTTPTPVITGISLTGTTLNISATNGTGNATYYLLQSTNIALPFAQWTPVLTNTFDGSGDINLSTNILNSADAQEFYILQVP